LPNCAEVVHFYLPKLSNPAEVVHYYLPKLLNCAEVVQLRRNCASLITEIEKYDPEIEPYRPEIAQLCRNCAILIAEIVTSPFRNCALLVADTTISFPKAPYLLSPAHYTSHYQYSIRRFFGGHRGGSLN
jgi:hypothetical protein